MKDTQHCLIRIRAIYAQLGEKEQKIADFILKDPKYIIHSTITQLAEDTNVSEATIFRFCKRLGFKGFQSMKISLASEVIEPIQQIHETIQQDDDEKAVAEKVFQSNAGALEDTSHVLDQNNLQLAVDAMCKAKRIEFYGNAGSGIVAQDAHHKFLRSGIPTIAYTDSHLQLMSSSQLTEKDVVVLISHSGTNKDILLALDVAKDSGVKTIGITSFAKTPLSQQVDIPLYTVSKETQYRSEAFASRIAQLSIIDALYVNVNMRRQDLINQALDRMRKAISHKKI